MRFFESSEQIEILHCHQFNEQAKQSQVHLQDQIMVVKLYPDSLKHGQEKAPTVKNLKNTAISWKKKKKK